MPLKPQPSFGIASRVPPPPLSRINKQIIARLRENTLSSPLIASSLSIDKEKPEGKIYFIPDPFAPDRDFLSIRYGSPTKASRFPAYWYLLHRKRRRNVYSERESAFHPPTDERGSVNSSGLSGIDAEMRDTLDAYRCVYVCDAWSRGIHWNFEYCAGVRYSDLARLFLRGHLLIPFSSSFHLNVGDAISYEGETSWY